MTSIFAAAGGTQFTLGNMLSGLQASAVMYVQIIIAMIGVVMVGFGVYQIAKGLISHGKGQTNWVTAFILIVLGGVLMLSTGFSLLTNISKGTGTSLTNMGADAQGDKVTYYDPETHPLQ